MESIWPFILAAFAGGFGALATMVASRFSPLAPLQKSYVSALEGRNALLVQENDDYKSTIIKLQNEVIELRKEINELRREVRRLERENLDLYRGTGLTRRDESGRYVSSKETTGADG